MSTGQLAMWSIATADTAALMKKVVWRPVTAATVLKVGQPVCYNSDATSNIKEETTNRLSSDFGGENATTFAEGAQTYNARFTLVEEPLTANLHAFAGIVKSLGPLGGADGDTIEIWEPIEGSVVPVFCAQNCTLDRTIMGIRDGQADIDYPGRAVGVARETVDRSSVDGLVWMEFKKFEYNAIKGAGDSASNSLIVDDEITSNNVVLDQRNYRFDGTGRARALYYVGEIAGLGNAMWGMWKFRTYVNAALVSSVVHVVTANLHFKDAATIAVTSGHWNSAFYGTVETEVTSTAPTLSGGSVAGISLEYYVDESVAAPANAYAIYIHAGTYNWDGLVAIRNAGDCGDVATVQAGDASGGSIPIYIAGTTYYLHYWTAAS
ncbi:hypothetical protein LCGC14_0356390 [marine sediment metagenome]|uniref:Uncharacterized protein n=1 Tax=marine sediment metagenome TaxID=412755 RepID=A0A0F9TSG9_9ZZZZ